MSSGRLTIETLRAIIATLVWVLIFRLLTGLAQQAGQDLWVGPAMVAGAIAGAVYFWEEA